MHKPRRTICFPNAPFLRNQVTFSDTSDKILCKNLIVKNKNMALLQVSSFKPQFLYTGFPL